MLSPGGWGRDQVAATQGRHGVSEEVPTPLSQVVITSAVIGVCAG